MSEQIPIDFNESEFEKICNVNGESFWYARDFMKLFKIDDFTKFRKAINRAMSACLSANIPLEETILFVKRNIDGQEVEDYKLSRFGCYLVALNGNPKNDVVAKAQAYFARIAQSFTELLKENEIIDRIIVRDEITDKERSLAAVAQRAGVESFQLFHNAGYRGMYNMNMGDLKRLRGLNSKDILLNYMGKTELAANLFRITQTEEKIKNNNISGQKHLERTANDVGKTVRETIISIQGTAPEYLPKHENIDNLKRNLKSVQKGFKQIDGKKTKEKE